MPIDTNIFTSESITDNARQSFVAILNFSLSNCNLQSLLTMSKHQYQVKNLDNQLHTLEFDITENGDFKVEGLGKESLHLNEKGLMS